MIYLFAILVTLVLARSGVAGNGGFYEEVDWRKV